MEHPAFGGAILWLLSSISRFESLSFRMEGPQPDSSLRLAHPVQTGGIPQFAEQKLELGTAVA